MAGDTTAVYLPDPDLPQYANLFRDNATPEFPDYLRKNKHRNLRDTDSERPGGLRSRLG